MGSASVNSVQPFTPSNQPHSPGERRLIPLVVFLGLGLLFGSYFATPYLTESTVGDWRIRATIRVALLYYGITALLLMHLRQAEWSPPTWRCRLTRWCWTLAWVAYIVHLGSAFHYYHGWSHADAVEHTREVS